jgi:NitT/TauT family transport system substrate-binding protein
LRAGGRSGPARSFRTFHFSLFTFHSVLWLSCLGCGGDSGKTATDEAGRRLDRVTLQLNWFPEMEHGGFYAAAIHGYYREEGLQVDIKAGGARTPVVQEVATGRAEFAIGNADEILIGRAGEADVVAIMAPLQENPRCILVHKDSGVKSLEQMRGLKLAIKTGAPFEEYLRSKGLLDGVETIQFTGGVSHFLADRNHAQQGYVFSEPYIARQQGADPESLMVSTAGFNPYAGLLFTSGETIAEQPDLVRRMVRASVRGWRKYLEDPQATNEEIHRVNDDMTMEALAFGAEAMKPLCLPDGLPAERLGEMNRERWQTLADQLDELGMLDRKTVDVNEAFTTRFVDNPSLVKSEK